MEVSGQLYAPAVLPPRKNPGTVEQGARWVARSVWALGEAKYTYFAATGT